MGKQKIYSVSRWDAASKHLEYWTVFCSIFLGYPEHHPSTMEMKSLIKEMEVVDECFQSQAKWQYVFSATLLHIVESKFN